MLTGAQIPAWAAPPAEGLAKTYPSGAGKEVDSEPSAFYDPPATLPAGDPGTIIRSEEIDDLPAGQVAQRILYTSTDPDGAPIAVSGVVVRRR